MVRAKRGGAAVTVGTTGGLVAVPNALALSGPLDGPGTALAALGLLIGLALAAGAVLLVDSGISTAHVVRIAGWNGLGVVVLGLVLALVTLTGSASLPAFVAAGILGVSAVAHVLIGVNDVRRIRTAELAREREKLAVLNRVARHNLRNDAQVLHGVADLVDADTDPEVRDEASERVAAVGDDLASMSGRLREMQAIVDDETTPRTCSLPDLVERVVADCREQYPAATITVDLPDESVRAGERLETALGHLLENAIVHTDEQTVEVSASAVGETVTLVVADDGPGIPEMETEILTGERDRTQVEHASGLGLWVVKAAVEDLGGRVAFGDDGDGGEVRLQLPVA